MKNRKNIIRFLASLSMLIFFSPFFQMCSDKSIKRSSSFIKSYHNAETAKEKEIAFEKAKKDFSLSGYDLAMSFEPVLLSFTLIMFLNITLLVCFIRKHYNQLFLCFLNLSAILLSFIVLIFTLPNLGQIRYGIFLCLINSMLLFYFVYKEQENGTKKSESEK
ncbi:hypothetical protein SGQ44_13400 [Flavobacterium sp. Fl-77]|uniref:Uncharacterized protein n=1 Tax=Flavobacterium flavipigmentatum TaxID=2893884 RepID=A0AAJ2SIE1_9FLAO|nr:MULTISPECIES: hypothetical protein [unclassified Flavobacterium]MDX6183172.1 hypothetical protein [Flavobacterium sp. Fl-33]MDX6186759.1 hypothetical protein [Flavobacterium sp. Fl-77]UFH40413.1 hypothetical protein LNP22_09080 [Flavobacterium sp. F-70]